MIVIGALALSTVVGPGAATAASRASPLGVDHTRTDLGVVPANWVDSARSGIRRQYAHTPNGSQIAWRLYSLTEPHLERARRHAGAIAAFRDSLAPDELDAASLDRLFVEKCGAVGSELDPRENAAAIDLDAVEARSLVAAAEEMYLYGNMPLAIRLLDEAAGILRRNR